jgi:hypothetical protein
MTEKKKSKRLLQRVDRRIQNTSKSDSSAQQVVNKINIKIGDSAKKKKTKRKKTSSKKAEAVEELEDAANEFDMLKEVAAKSNVKLPASLLQLDDDLSKVKKIEDIKNITVKLKEKSEQIKRLLPPQVRAALPAPPTRHALPAPPTRHALPAPPTRHALPAPPTRHALPAPPSEPAFTIGGQAPQMLPPFQRMGDQPLPAQPVPVRPPARPLPAQPVPVRPLPIPPVPDQPAPPIPPVPDQPAPPIPPPVQPAIPMLTDQDLDALDQYAVNLTDRTNQLFALKDKDLLPEIERHVIESQNLINFIQNALPAQSEAVQNRMNSYLLMIEEALQTLEALSAELELQPPRVVELDEGPLIDEFVRIEQQAVPNLSQAQYNILIEQTRNLIVRIEELREEGAEGESIENLLQDSQALLAEINALKTPRLTPQLPDIDISDVQGSEPDEMEGLGLSMRGRVVQRIASIQSYLDRLAAIEDTDSSAFTEPIVEVLTVEIIKLQRAIDNNEAIPEGFIKALPMDNGSPAAITALAWVFRDRGEPFDLPPSDRFTLVKDPDDNTYTLYRNNSELSDILFDQNGTPMDAMVEEVEDDQGDEPSEEDIGNRYEEAADRLREWLTPMTRSTLRTIAGQNGLGLPGYFKPGRSQRYNPSQWSYDDAIDRLVPDLLNRQGTRAQRAVQTIQFLNVRIPDDIQALILDDSIPQGQPVEIAVTPPVTPPEESPPGAVAGEEFLEPIGEPGSLLVERPLPEGERVVSDDPFYIYLNGLPMDQLSELYEELSGNEFDPEINTKDELVMELMDGATGGGEEVARIFKNITGSQTPNIKSIIETGLPAFSQTAYRAYQNLIEASTTDARIGSIPPISEVTNLELVAPPSRGVSGGTDLLSLKINGTRIIERQFYPDGSIVPIAPEPGDTVFNIDEHSSREEAMSELKKAHKEHCESGSPDNKTFWASSAAPGGMAFLRMTECAGTGERGIVSFFEAYDWSKWSPERQAPTTDPGIGRGGGFVSRPIP